MAFQALSVTLLAATLACPLFSQTPTDLPLTLLDVQVADPLTGHPLRNLEADDFEIFENEHPQQLTFFAQDTVPLDLVMLVQAGVDLSDKTRPLLDALTPDDRVAVMRFRGKSRVLLPFSSDTAAIGEALEQARTWGVTGLRTVWRGREPYEVRICDAVWRACDLFSTPADCLRKRAVVILTDDRDSPSTLIEPDVANRLLALGATLNGAIVSHPSRREWTAPPLLNFPAPDNIEEARCQANRVIEATSGELVKRRWPATGIGDVFKRLRNRYLLGYIRTPAVAEEVEIAVRLREAEPDIRFRTGHCVGDTRSQF